MALNGFVFATVRVLIRDRNQDVLGSYGLQGFCELFPPGKLDIYAVSPALADVIEEGDLVLVDIGLAHVPQTAQAAPKNEIVKVIRNATRERILNLYQKTTSRPERTVGTA